MDIFDLKTGSLYAALALASSTYLLWGFRIRLRSLLKAMLAIQVLADLFFFPLLLDLPVSDYVVSLTAQDRIYPLLVLMGCVVAMDIGAALCASLAGPGRAGMRKTTKGGAVPSQSTRAILTASEGGPVDQPLKLDKVTSKQVGIALVLLAVLARLCQLYFVGLLGEPAMLLSILTWQPERSLGFSFLELIGSLLFPIGLALFVMSTRRRPHTTALVLMLVFGSLSPWKGGIVKLVVVYGLTLQQFGWSEVRAAILKKSSIALGVAILFILPIKAQFRTVGRADLAVRPMTDAFFGTLMGHSGEVFETYTYIIGSLERGYPLMRGSYNQQVLYLWVPRLLWKDKPNVAGMEIYYYLELTRDRDGPYGVTAYPATVFGTFYLDFGLWGSLLCSLFFGGLLASGDNLLGRLRKARSHTGPVYYVVFCSLWLNSTFALSEGGVPPAFTEALVASAAVCVSILYFFPLKARGSVLPARARTEPRVHAAKI